MSRYTVNEDGTYTDTQTGLIWQGESHGPMTWHKAMDYAEALGDGWRLPTVEELVGLVDYDLNDPATELPGMMASLYWSSSTGAYSPFYAWTVGFGSGYVNDFNKASDSHVRCVRTTICGGAR